MHGKCIFWKCFSVLTCLWCELISVFILPSNTIFRKTERGRECASEIAPARKERERERGHCRRPTSFDFAGDPETSRHEPRSSFDFAIQLWLRIAPIDFAGEPRGQDRRSTSSSNCTLWLRRRTQRPGLPFDLEFESHPLTSPANPEARITIRLQLRRHRSHWVRDWEIVGFWWIWPGLMNFF